jgi:hypothetical protein
MLPVLQLAWVEVCHLNVRNFNLFFFYFSGWYGWNGRNGLLRKASEIYWNSFVMSVLFFSMSAAMHLLGNIK